MQTQIATVADLFDSWLSHIRRLGRSPLTLSSYRYKIDAVLRPRLGEIPLEDLSVLSIDQFYGELLDEGMSPATVNHHHRILRAALGQATRWGLLAVNPARLATPPTSRPSGISPPSRAQVGQLIEAAERGPTPLLGSVIYIASTTGMRRGELAGLRWEDFDDERATIEVIRSIWQVSAQWGVKDPKSHQRRRITVGPRTAEVFEVLRRRSGHRADPESYVFSLTGGRVPWLPEAITRSFSRVIRSLEASTGEPWPFRFHDLRHFTATELFRTGHSPRTVANRLGHADVAVTLRTYTHDTDDQARQAAESIEVDF